jgi:prevent-host-death family protein
MKSVSVSELKARLSEYLRRVKAGERVVVTERGKPVAEIVAVRPYRDPDDIDDLVKAGLIRRGSGEPLPDDFWDMPRPKDPEGLVLKALLEERRSGW